MNQTDPAAIEPPATLNADAQARWRAVLPDLARRGPVDLETFAAYCQMWARWRDAEAGVAKFGTLVKGPGDRPIANPLIGVANQSADRVVALEQRLGIGEPDRQAVEGAGAGEGVDEPPVPAAGETQWRLVNRVQLAEVLGVHVDTVTDYARLGMPVVYRGGRGRESTYDTVLCSAWWRDQQGANAKEAAQARAMTASAELNELKLQREREEVWPRAAIILAGQTVIKGWTSAVRAIPRRLVQAGLIARGQEPAAAAVCADLLRDIVAWDPLESVGVKKRRAS